MATPPRGDEREYGRGCKPRRASGAAQAERRGHAQRTRPGEQSLEVESVVQAVASVVNGPPAAPRSSSRCRVNEVPVARRAPGPRLGECARVNGTKASGVERRHGSGRGKSSEGSELHERSGMKEGRVARSRSKPSRGCETLKAERTRYGKPGLSGLDGWTVLKEPQTS